MKTCAVDGCTSPYRSKGFCNKHYLKWRKYGSPTGLTDTERFERFVDRGGECHIWKEGRSAGYGHFQLDGKDRGAHVAAWMLVNGPVPEGFFVCHRCDNPKCVRVEHLFLGTREENIADMVAKGRHTIGVRNPHARLTEDEVREIRASDANWNDLARTFGVHKRTIWKVRTRRSWRHVD